MFAHMLYSCNTIRRVDVKIREIQGFSTQNINENLNLSQLYETALHGQIDIAHINMLKK